ncbi:hypothetical protein [Burkholderia ubonensis]|uniref:hypothetical protein n=1 Tax=Burkholderia ubonensis TaxID=101571 RepID=UPI00075BE77A|nr:hypothetical protein [Burkholderia ubonensis]KVM05507.1 hypothetical protein WJ51_26340 [Burkholderia ubonensis]KVM09651.1 hypothetical protein WJ52_23640 [Burkholderia ubonensis]KVM53162.1 hypothetical protein WJ56_09215 [Burkholderia ubonensis]KVO16048.1 hypothetical protein WJ72_11030 [Burkholderia ubonensis]
MTLRELRKHLRDNTFSDSRAPAAPKKHVNSPLALHIARVAAGGDSSAQRLRLPSTDMPVLP